MFNEIAGKTDLLPVTSDFIFKLIFGDARNVDILASFLMTVLNIPAEEYDRLTVVDPHVKKDDGEVLSLIAERSPVMRKAVGVLKELSADERTRMLYEAQETARRDIASMMGGAKEERSVEIALNLISIGLDNAAISKATGLTEDEIELLRVQSA